MKSSDVTFVVSQGWLMASYFIDSWTPIAIGLLFAACSFLQVFVDLRRSK